MFQRAILSSSRVCSNCFRRRRRPAVRPREFKPDEEYDERIRWRTTVEDVPDVVVREQQTLFCECGTSAAHTRYWDDEDLRGDPDDDDKPDTDRDDRFGELLTNALVTLARLEEITTEREMRRIAERAWAAWREGASVNEAIGTAVDAVADDTGDADADQPVTAD